MAEVTHDIWTMAGRFWQPLTRLSRICLIVTLALLLAWVMSSGEGHGGTTDSRLDTFILHHGFFIWKHRSAPGADFVSQIGGWRGISFPLYLGEVIRIPTRGGQRLWYIEVPLWFVASAVTLTTTILVRRDRRRDRAKGFPVEPVRPDRSISQTSQS